MSRTFFARLCVVAMCMYSTFTYAHHTYRHLLIGHTYLSQQTGMIQKNNGDEKAVTQNQIERLQRLRMDLESSNKYQESEFLRLINGFTQEIETFNEASLNLLRNISDAAYNKNMSLLFIATQGLLIDYDLSNYHLGEANKKRNILVEQRVLPSSNDRLNFELELDLLAIWNYEFTN